jgi:predicted ribosome quality control (RQC) complex YloA/Tae2 family protein
LRLILELFGDGNLILASAEGAILQALKFKRMRDRNILRGEAYAFPPLSGRNPLQTTREELAEALKDCGDAEVVKALARGLGVGGIYAEEILLRANVEKSTPCAKLTDAEADAVHTGLQNLLNSLATAEFEPCIVLADDGSFLDAVPFHLKRYEACKTQPFTCFNDALDQFYLRVTAAEKAAGGRGKVDELRREADRLARVVSEQEETVREGEAKAEEERRVGDAIYANSMEIQALLDGFAGEKAAGRDLSSWVAKVVAAGTHEARRRVVVEAYDPRNVALNVHVDKVRFSLQLRKSLFENAAEYYGSGKRAKQKVAGAQAALEDSRRRLAEAERQIQAAETVQLSKPAEVIEEMAKRRIEGKEWFEKFRWFTSSDGMLVVAGKDVVSNEVLVKKHTEKDDIVFHAEITGAPFVVVKTENKVPTEQTLREAGEFAAAFSRAWREGMGSVDVYWVKPEQLSKTGPSGEYVAHGAFFIVGKRNWMRGVPLRVAVGIVEVESQVEFVGGPVNAVKARAKVYVTLMPGDMMGKEILKQILRSLAVKLPKEQREKIAQASIEEIREFVPYTKGRIAENL